MKTIEKQTVVQAPAPAPAGRSLYMSKGIYNNYAKSMKDKNVKRKWQGLKAIYIRTYEEWSHV